MSKQVLYEFGHTLLDVTPREFFVRTSQAKRADLALHEDVVFHGRRNMKLGSFLSVDEHVGYIRMRQEDGTVYCLDMDRNLKTIERVLPDRPSNPFAFRTAWDAFGRFQDVIHRKDGYCWEEDLWYRFYDEEYPAEMRGKGWGTYSIREWYDSDIREKYSLREETTGIETISQI